MSDCPFKPGDHVRFVRRLRESSSNLKDLTGKVVRVVQNLGTVWDDLSCPDVVYKVYGEWTDGGRGFGYHYNLELVQKMTIRGNELCFEQEEK